MEQLRQRVLDAQKQGLTIGVVTCFVHQDEKGQRSYEPAFSTLPVEVTLWAAEKIKRRIIEVLEE